jgi:glycosyltransferase involved in cell wall biosynthesis
MTVIEAMLSSLPVVASNIHGVQEQVLDGRTGLLVPLADPAALRDALARLIADPTLRQYLGTAGRNRALALFTEEQVVARTLDLLGL